MKKIFLHTLSALAIALPVSAFSAEEDTAPAPTTPTAPANYVVPTPQQTRINGLIERLGQNYAHEIETITGPNGDFLGLFRESESGDPQGCVLILHGDHGHPDWPQAVSPLRRKLPQHSWCTLAIEVPDVQGRSSPVMPRSDANGDTPATNASETAVTIATGNDAENSTLPNEEEVFARIDASLQLIRTKGYQQAAYLGYRSGATYMLKYAAQKNLVGQALMLIDMRSVEPVSEFQISQQIESLKLPTLDYYFNNGTLAARFARYRQAAANKRPDQSEPYTQLDALPDQRFDPTGDKRLVQRVWGFLKQNTVQDKQRKDLSEFDKQLFYKSSVIP